jgi:hypothetical protein
MDKQQQAPIQSPFFMGELKTITPVWQRWFQRLKTRDDEIRRRPYKEFSGNGTLTTWELGKTVLFNIGATDSTCNLMTIETKDLWSWVHIIRMGTGRLAITADSLSRIEYSSIGGSIYGDEKKRRAANVMLQLVAENQWAIIGGLGIWEVD